VIISGTAIRVTPEETLMILPPSRSRGRARWVMKNGARALTAKIRSNSSRVVFSKSLDVAMAALFTRMSRPSNSSSSRANSVSTASGALSSARTANARSSPIAATVSLAAASSSARRSTASPRTSRRSCAASGRLPRR
jgi:hypothetical protein